MAEEDDSCALKIAQPPRPLCHTGPRPNEMLVFRHRPESPVPSKHAHWCIYRLNVLYFHQYHL